MLLAKFFKVHPGYLVDDPDGYHTELISDARVMEDTLDLWLISGAERFRRDPKVFHALLQVAKHEDSRRCIVLMGAKAWSRRRSPGPCSASHACRAAKGTSMAK